MTIQFRVGDVFARLDEIPAGSIDLVVTSPPFLALRSYLPAEHPDKHKEIGSEPTPAEFIDTLLALTAEWGRVLAPHGSICVELGDTYSGSGGGGGDYLPGGLREGQQQFAGSASSMRESNAAHWRAKNAWKQGPRGTNGKGRPVDDTSGGHHLGGAGWPLAKSMCLIPHLYTIALAYGFNPLTGAASPAGQWRIRNVICWARPNPPVGALGDKFRPATSYITVATRAEQRYFDLDAVRTAGSPNTHARLAKGTDVRPTSGKKAEHPDNNFGTMDEIETVGAPPLDWHADEHPEDGDWLWKLPTRPYKGSHYAAYPETLPKRLVEAMCPRRVCTACGQPSVRIVESVRHIRAGRPLPSQEAQVGAGRSSGYFESAGPGVHVERSDRGWSHCACGDGCRPTTWRVDVLEVVQVKIDGRWVDADDLGEVPDDAETRTTRKRQRHVDDIGECNDPTHWRTGNVLDPFVGSGTTLAAALGLGRHAVGIDLDERNADLARERCGMFLEVDHPKAGAA